MRAFSISIDYSSSSYPILFLQVSPTTNNNTKFINFSTQQEVFSTTKYHLHSNSRFNNPRCSTTESNTISDDFDDYDNDNDNEDDGDCYSYIGEESKSEFVGEVREDGIYIEVTRIGKNSRRIRSKIGINANFDTIWSVLTDYEKLADFLPGLAVSKILDKKDNCCRVYQIGQQNLPFGMKFNAKAILDCYEKDLEASAMGKKRDIEFKMTEGDFHLFEGKWSIEQFNKPRSEHCDLSLGQEFETILTYFLDVKPKPWVPVHLVEGRICKEIKTNLSCIREEAQKPTHNTLEAQ